MIRIASMSHICLYVHFVFATKHRHAWIQDSWKPRLHDYIGGTIRGLNATPLGIGGVEDHVHLLVSLNATHQTADIMRKVKRSSSAWIHEAIKLRSFARQDGYGAFSVSPNACDSVKRYIDNQVQHHKSQSSRDEYIHMLRASESQFDPQYIE